MGRRTFIRRCEEATEASPGEWILQERLAHACNLLEETKMSIGQWSAYSQVRRGDRPERTEIRDVGFAGLRTQHARERTGRDHLSCPQPEAGTRQFKRAIYGRVSSPRNALPLFNSSLYCQTGLKLATDRSILARSLKKSSCCRRKRSSNIRGGRFTLCTLSKK